MAERLRGYAHRVDVRAEVSEVWRFLIEPALIARWFATQARVDAREGGSYWFRLDPQLTREAHIDVFRPPNRLRLLYMPLPDLPQDEAVLVDDFLLDQQSSAQGGALTVVRLLGSGIPEAKVWDATYLRLRATWERAMLRLKSAVERPKP